MGFTGVAPPDTVGDVGPNHFIQSINGSGGALFRVFDKSGTPLTGSIAMDSLPGTAHCQNNGYGDPIILYDDAADRWLVSQFAFPDNGPEGVEGETAYYVDYQGARIVSLNSSGDRDAQAEWLDRILAENPRDWVIVTHHHPIFSASLM